MGFDAINLEEYLILETYGQQLRKLNLYGKVRRSSLVDLFICPECNLRNMTTQFCYGTSCSIQLTEFLTKPSKLTDDELMEKIRPCMMKKRTI